MEERGEGKGEVIKRRMKGNGDPKENYRWQREGQREVERSKERRRGEGVSL